MLAGSPTADGKVNGTNGHLSAEENARWVERVGWAPRFGAGSFPDDEEDDGAQDHQTWVETRLDDKFFGGQSRTYTAKRKTPRAFEERPS